MPEDDPSVQVVLDDVAQRGGSVSVVDEDHHHIHVGLPLTLPDGREAIVVGTLSAEEEFAFFAPQRSEAIRHAILLSVGIVALTSGIGAGLSAAVSRTLTNRQQAEQTLRASEARYRALFEDAPIALVEQDLSAVSARVDALPALGQPDLASYFEAHPEELAEAASQIRTLDVNSAAMELFEGESKKELQERWNETFVAETYKAFGEALLTLAGGAQTIVVETPIRTLRGAVRVTHVHVAPVPGADSDWSRLLGREAQAGGPSPLSGSRL